MTSGTLAIPWAELPKWLKSKLKTQRLELRNHWRRGGLEKDWKGAPGGKKEKTNKIW